MISFVIPAHNEQLLIGRTITAVHAAARAAGKPYEVIVADDASTDTTAVLAERHGARVVRVNHRQIAATRNAGARAARGDALVFVDADTLVTPAVVRGALRAVRRGAAGGGCVARFDGRLPLWAKLVFPVGAAGQHVLKLVGGCFLFCTRPTFEAAGGFCERYFAGEELAFARALKRHGRFVVLHEYVITSGRKLRTLSTGALLRTLWRAAVGGPEAFRQRDGLEVWYGERREDPEHLPGAKILRLTGCGQRETIAAARPRQDAGASPRRPGIDPDG